MSFFGGVVRRLRCSARDDDERPTRGRNAAVNPQLPNNSTALPYINPTVHSPAHVRGVPSSSGECAANLRERLGRCRVLAQDADCPPYEWIAFEPIGYRGSCYCVQLDRILLYDERGQQIALVKAVNPGGSNPAGEGPDNICKQWGKWLDMRKGPIAMKLSQTSLVQSYTLVTANDEPARDPILWRLYGSVDGANWDLIDDRSKSAQRMPTQRNSSSEMFKLKSAQRGAAKDAVKPLCDKGHDPQLAETAVKVSGGDERAAEAWLGQHTRADAQKRAVMELGYPAILAEFALLMCEDAAEAAEWLIEQDVSCGPNDSIHQMFYTLVSGLRCEEDKTMKVLSSANRPLLPEYAAVEAGVCISRDLMRSSRLMEVSQWLQALPFPGSGARTVVQACTNRVLQLIKGSQVKAYESSFVGVANALPDVHKNLLLRAIWHLTSVCSKVGDAEDLVQTLRAIDEGSHQCMARKLDMTRMAILTAGQRRGDGSANPQTPPSQRSVGPNFGGSAELEACLEGVLEACKSFIDTHKEKAFATTFVQPSEMYFRAVGDSIMEGDAGVHGSNTWAALLLFSLGVCTPHAAYFEDEAKGFANFVAANMTHLPALWSDGNFGRGATHPAVAPRGARSGCGKRVRTNDLMFSGATAWEIACESLDPNARRTAARQLWGNGYLKQFCRYFSAEFILERMYLYLRNDAHLEKPLDALFNAFNKREKDEKLENGGAAAAASTALQAAEGEGEAGLQFWLFDEENDYKFDPRRAQEFFAFLGIARAP